MDTKIFSILILLLLAVSCVKQDHNNPFDSQCPKELWTPTDFKATLEGTTVKLTWNQSENRISGFKLTKKVDTGTESALTNQSKDANQLTDATLTGGKVHVYTLVAYAGNNQSNVVTTQITPTFLATVTTVAATSITANSAILGGSITTDGGAAITERGICWATTASPTTAANKLAIGTGSGTFSNAIAGLLPSTLYYFRAYAINSLGTAYGNEVTATTLSALPTLTTTAISAITPTTATSGGIITYEGASAVTARGVCWSTSQNPTISFSKTTDGTGTGMFTSNITGLTTSLQYYVRAYASNGQGTSYGNEQVFTSITPVLTISTANQDVTGVAGSTSFAITSNVSWTASSNQTWCTITNLSGTGNATLAITYAANTTNSQRIATLTITGLGMAAKTVTVTQKTVLPTSGLVAYYPFNGNANDESGNGNNGTVNGATLIPDRNGNSNKAYSFDGISNYISIPNSTSICPSNLTVSLWVKIPTQTIGDYKGIIVKRFDEFSEPFNSYAIEIKSSTYISFTISNGSRWGRIETLTNFSFDTWQHIVGTYDGQYAKVYINGVLKNSNNYTSGLGYSSLPFRIAMLCFNPSQNNVFNGNIDDIRIFNRALTESEIQQFYNE